MLEVCRIQTSSEGKEQDERGKKITPAFTTTVHVYSVLTVYETVLNRIGLYLNMDEGAMTFFNRAISNYGRFRESSFNMTRGGMTILRGGGGSENF